MRISSPALAGALLLAGCDKAPAPPPVIENVEEQVAVAREEDDGRILCAPAGTQGFSRACTLERAQDSEGMILTLQLPDGGFHRVRVVSDGRGLVAADGAEPAEVRTVADGLIEVAIGGARFRLPATTAGQ